MAARRDVVLLVVPGSAGYGQTRDVLVRQLHQLRRLRARAGRPRIVLVIEPNARTGATVILSLACADHVVFGPMHLALGDALQLLMDSSA